MLTLLIKAKTQHLIKTALTVRFYKSNSFKNLQPFQIPKSPQDIFSPKFTFNQYISAESQLNAFQEMDEDSQEPFVRKQSVKKAKNSVSNLESDSIKVMGFSRDVHLFQRIQNSKKITETIACLLNEQQYTHLQELINKYVEQIGYQNIFSKKISNKEKQLFKKIKIIFFQSIEDAQSVEELMQLFSESDPKLIQLQEIKKLYEFKNYDQDQALSPSNKYKIMLQTQKKMDDKQHKYQNSQKPTKVYLKRKVVQGKLEASQSTLQKVDQKLFGNRKIVEEDVILKKVVQKNKDKEKQKFGQNWIYTYDLPYDLDLKDAEEIIHILSQKYGEIIEYSISPYRNMLQKSDELQTIYTIPDNFHQSTKKNVVKLEKQRVDRNLKVQQEVRKHGKKTLTTRILQKTKKQKQLTLNKSSMVFKFKNIEDKYKFLTPQMRLFGLNINKFSNVKFEEAQSKNTIAVNMVHWGCKSGSLLKFLNDALLPINVNLSYENSVIMKSFIFIELDNFYEAYYAKNLLNNLIFQQQRLKAQINYGPCRINCGEYKTSLQFKHYDQLVKRINDIRNFYNDVYQ